MTQPRINSASPERSAKHRRQSRPIPTTPDGSRTIALLEAAGFEGPDLSLAISLFEYDIAWRDDGVAFTFIFRRRDGRFDSKSIRKDVKLQREWNGVDYGALANTMGTSLRAWLRRPLTVQVQELILYHGRDNVLGSPGVCFEIEPLNKK